MGRERSSPSGSCGWRSAPHECGANGGSASCLSIFPAVSVGYCPPQARPYTMVRLLLYWSPPSNSSPICCEIWGRGSPHSYLLPSQLMSYLGSDVDLNVLVHHLIKNNRYSLIKPYKNSTNRFWLNLAATECLRKHKYNVRNEFFNELIKQNLK